MPLRYLSNELINYRALWNEIVEKRMEWETLYKQMWCCLLAHLPLPITIKYSWTDIFSLFLQRWHKNIRLVFQVISLQGEVHSSIMFLRTDKPSLMDICTSLFTFDEWILHKIYTVRSSQLFSRQHIHIQSNHSCFSHHLYNARTQWKTQTLQTSLRMH